MSKFSIPASIDRATAIVFAFTTAADGPGKAKRSSALLSPKEFASLGVAGLRSDHSVRRYRNAWQEAIDAGHVRDVAPGDDVVLPDLPFPPHVEVTNADRRAALNAAADAENPPAGHRSTQQIATHLPALKAAIKADPKVAAAAREALDQRSDVPTPQPRPATAAREGLELLGDFRALHKTLASILDRIIGGNALIVPSERDALLSEVQWLRNALDHVESGLASDSLDQELAAFLGSQS